MRSAIRLGIAAALALAFTPAFADESSSSSSQMDPAATPCDPAVQACGYKADQSEAPKASPDATDPGSGSGEPESRARADAEQEWIHSVWTTP